MDYNRIPAINWSTLRWMATSPRACHWHASHPREDTAAMALGRAVHTAVLEPDLWAGRYAIRPEGLDGRTKAGREWSAALPDGIEILSVDQARIVDGCVDAIRRNGHAIDALEGTEREVALEWEMMTARCKGRIDALASWAVVDLKTCRDLASFQRDSERHLYHGQLTWYLDGAIAAGRCAEDAIPTIIAVETAPPHDVAVFEIWGAVLGEGRRLWRRLLSEYLVCQSTGDWPGQYPGVAELELPRWHRMEADDEQ